MLHIITISKAICDLKIVSKCTPNPLSWVLYQPSVPRNFFHILENMLEYQDLHTQIITSTERTQLSSHQVTLYVLKPSFFCHTKPKGFFGNGFRIFIPYTNNSFSSTLFLFFCFVLTKWLCTPQRIKWMHLK